MGVASFYHWLRSERRFLLIVAVGLAATSWGVFTFARSIETKHLRQVCYGSEIVIADYCDSAYLRQRDPYCIVDPTCLSPDFERSELGYGKGLAIIGDPALIYSNPLRMLAVSNLGLFIVVMLGWLGVGLLMLRRRRWREMLVTFVATWYLLEIARWVEAAWRLSLVTQGSTSTFYLDPGTYLGIAVLVLPLGVTYLVLGLRYGSTSSTYFGCGRCLL